MKEKKNPTLNNSCTCITVPVSASATHWPAWIYDAPQFIKLFLIWFHWVMIMEKNNNNNCVIHLKHEKPNYQAN